MAYPTTDELVAESTTDELLSLTPDQQEGMRLTAIFAIEQFTGQTFEPVVETRTLRGTRKRVVYLPKRLESLTAVTVSGAALTGVVVSDDFDAIELPVAAGMSTYEKAYADVSGEPMRGFDGELKVTGTWGWTVCPEAVKTAIRFDMEEQALADTNELSSTIAAYRKLGVSNVTQGNLRLQIGDEVVLSPRVQRQLVPYVWTPIGEQV